MIRYIIPSLFAFLGYMCSRPEKAAVVNASIVRSDTVVIKSEKFDFNKDIVPILKTHCSPCHFEGGKMFARIPFDDPKTIQNKDFQPGIFRRIKGEDEVRKIRQFLEQSE